MPKLELYSLAGFHSAGFNAPKLHFFFRENYVLSFARITCSRLTTNYHALSFTLNMFKIFMTVEDSFDRLTERMIVYDSLGSKLSSQLSSTIMHRLIIKLVMKFQNRGEPNTLSRFQKIVRFC